MTAEPQRLQEYLAAYKHESYCNETAIYLRILAFIHSEHPEAFAKISEIRGSKRIYFSEKPSDIIESGKSTMPEQIPGTAFYAYTNDNCDRKEAICREALKHFGYSSETLAAASSAFSKVKGDKSFRDMLI